MTAGGVQTGRDVIKAVMAGADAVQMTSILLHMGPEHVRKLRSDVVQWMEEAEYESIQQMRGSMSRMRCPEPSAYERGNYLRTLQIWDREH